MQTGGLTETRSLGRAAGCTVTAKHSKSSVDRSRSPQMTWRDLEEDEVNSVSLRRAAPVDWTDWVDWLGGLLVAALAGSLAE